MTVQELYNWCKAFKHKEAEVYLVGDEEIVDEEGWLSDLYHVTDISHQSPVIDLGMEAKEIHEVLIYVDKERAHSTINTNI